MAETLEQSAPAAPRSDRASSHPHVPDWWPPAIAAGLTLLALLLRLHRIDHEPLWLDEGYTLLFSGMSLPKLILVGGAHEHPPLYYLLVHAIRAVHDSYLVPRLVSAVAGALSVFAVYLVGARLFSRAAGLIAAALLAIAPLHVWYGQDGRGYELAGLFVLLSYWCLLRALDAPRLSSWIAYALLTVASIYTEYTTAFVLLPQALFLLTARRRGLTFRLLISWFTAAVLFAPWAATVAHDAAGIASDYWIPPPTLSSFSATLLEFLGFLTPCPSPPCRGTLIGLPVLAGNETAVALSVVALTLLIGIMRRDLAVTVTVTWLSLPFLLVLLLAVRRSLYLDRVFLDAGIALYLLIGWGVTLLPSINPARLRGRPTRPPDRPRPPARIAIPGVTALLIAGAVCAASLAQLNPIYAGGVNPDWRTLARDFAAAYRPGQSVIFMPGVLRSLLASYLPSGWHATRETPVWSRVYLDVPGWQSRYPQPSAPSLRQRVAIEARLRNVQFSAAARGQRDVWLITYNYSGMNDSRRWFSDRGFQLLLSQLYGGDTRLELWSQAGPSHLGPPVVLDDGFRHGWHHAGTVVLRGGQAVAQGNTVLARAFPLRAGHTYSVSIDYRGMPPAAKPVIAVRAFDRSGHLLATFPRTKWYDWPVTGVWLSQPFGFVAPPGAARAVLTLDTGWGQARWRHVAVYQER
jgi:4-amino-4-deoxy-L-arabinose transferase-like glycosyltransferase